MGYAGGCRVHIGETLFTIHPENAEEIRMEVRTHRSEAGIAFGKELLDRVLREAVWTEIIGEGRTDGNRQDGKLPDENAGGQEAGR